MRHLTCILPAEMERGDALSSWGSSYNASKSFQGIFSAMFLFVILRVLSILPFKMAPRCNAEVLSGVSKHKKAGMCLMGKILGWDKLRSAIAVMLATNLMLTNQQYIQYSPLILGFSFHTFSYLQSTAV